MLFLIAATSCTWIPAQGDIDGDGVANIEDCAPWDPAVHAGAVDICGDGVDAACDGAPCEGADARISASIAASADATLALDRAESPDALLVGSAEDATSGETAGAVWYFSGPLSGEIVTSQAQAALLGEPGSGLGASLVSADLDLDGVAELVAGGPDYARSGGAEQGAVWVLQGPLSGALTLDDAARWEGASNRDFAGSALVALVLVDGGLPALALAAPGADGATDEAGVVYLLDDPLAGGALADVQSRVLGELSHGELGTTMADAGDLDCDGVAELAMASNANDVQAAGPDAVWILGEPPDGTDAVSDVAAQILGDEATAQTGAALAGAGDVDGDGYDDLWIGEPAADDEGSSAFNEGAVGLVHGQDVPQAQHSAPLSEIATTRISGEAAGARLGTAIAGGRDADGDGLPDLLVGAPGEDDVPGAAWLVLAPFEPGDVTVASVGARYAEAGAGRLVAFGGDLGGDREGLLIGAADGIDLYAAYAP